MTATATATATARCTTTSCSHSLAQCAHNSHNNNTTTTTTSNNNNKLCWSIRTHKSSKEKDTMVVPRTESIIYCQLSIASKKDFNEEWRALEDVRKFVTDSFILTDLQEVRIRDIIDRIVDRLAECRQLPASVVDEAKSLMFVDRHSLSMVLANTMQGLHKSRTDGRLAYDNSWVVATASLASLHKRHVAITRFPQPVNFGRQSQEVRFLIVVLAPNKEKLTKSAWETGRTFATMFTDIGFRRRLLRAKSHDEIKAELLARAESLAREGALAESTRLTTTCSAPCHDYHVQTLSLGPCPLGRQSSIFASQHQLSVERDLECISSRGSMGGGLSVDFGTVVGANNQQLALRTASFSEKTLTPARVAHQNDQYLEDESLSDSTIASKHKLTTKSQHLEVDHHHHLQSNARAFSLGSAADFNLAASSSPALLLNGCGSPAGWPQTLLTTGGGMCCASSTGGCRFGLRRSSLDSSSSRASGFQGPLGSGLLRDLRRRSKFYLSDFTDGILGERSLYKTISTTVFLYFSVLLPCIAFGVVDTNNTDGHIDPKKTMIGQALGGLFFALFSGQPLVVVMTTAPLCIYVKVIYQISQDFQVDFGTFYAAVGLWMCAFLTVMSLTNSSNLMRYCTRSTEDIFALFTAFAFGSDGIKEAARSFSKHYWDPDCVSSSFTVSATGTMPAPIVGGGGQQRPTTTTTTAIGGGSSLVDKLTSNLSSINTTAPQHANSSPELESYNHHLLLLAQQAEPTTFLPQSSVHSCSRESCILFLFLMSGTLWLANSFSSFNETPYLSSRKREIIKDYALAISVLIFSFIGSYLFADIRLDVFEFADFTGLQLAKLGGLSLSALTVTCLLGFMLSVLFYIDQNICGAMVNNAPYKLKKGDYFHLDLFVLAILNAILSLTGLPWMHGKLPHSHLHSKSLADYEERVDDGHVHQMIVNIRETRLTSILCSLLIAGSLLAVPYPLSYIPLPVLSGVFLYTALAEFKSNSLVERICLLFTEQAAYPPNHYIRRCPQRKIHFFTLAQCGQLAVVTFIGFYPNPYVNMAFPLAVATFVPLRELLLPKVIDAKYLSSLDRPSLE